MRNCAAGRFVAALSRRTGATPERVGPGTGAYCQRSKQLFDDRNQSSGDVLSEVVKRRRPFSKSAKFRFESG